MKVSNFLAALSLAAGAAAQLGKAGLGYAGDISFESRQVQSIVDVVNGINTKAGALDTAIKSYNGGDASAVLSASEALNSAVSSGVATVKGAQEVSTTDALQIQPAVQTLTTTVNTTITDLIAKKSQIVAAGEGQTTEDALTTQLQGAKDLAAAITSKVPSSLQSLATQLSAGITEAIQNGVDAFKGTGGSSSGGSSSAAASPTASSGSSATSEASSPSSSESSGGSETTSSPTETASETSVPAMSSGPAQFTGAASSLNRVEGLGMAAFIVAALAI